MPDYRTTFPLVGARQDSQGSRTPVPVSELLTVKNGYIRLKEVPHFDPATDMLVFVTGYTEVLGTPGQPNHYMVNYLTGRVYFHESQNDASVRVNYHGLGSLVATDEINWLWEQAILRNSFVGLVDTADELTPRGFARVNTKGTRVDFAEATVGRAHSTAQIVHLGAGETLPVEGSIFDIFGLYRAVPAEQVSEDVSMAFSVHPEGSAEEVDGAFSLTGAAGNKATLLATNSFDVPDISRLTGIHMAGHIPDGSFLRVVLQAGDTYFRPSASGLVYLGNTLPASIKSVGATQFDLNAVTIAHLSPLTGMPIRVHAYIEANADGESPSISAHINVQYLRSGGFELVEHTAAFDTATSTWTIGTSAAGETFLLLQGSGHDDVLCACDVAEFDSVAVGESVTVSAPTQTAINVLQARRLPDDVVAQPAGAAPWQNQNGSALTGFTRVPGHIVSNFVPENKNLAALLPTSDRQSGFNSMTYPPAQLFAGNNLGTPSGGYVTRGIFGPAIRMQGSSFIPLSDSWMLWYSGNNGPGYANRTICGWFKWESGSPIIISSATAWWDNSNNQLYVRLYSDRVILYLGYTTRTVYYTPGTWVFVGVTGVWSWHKDGSRDDKGCNFIVNTGIYAVSHSLWNVPTHRVTVPGCIGEGSPNLSASGQYLVDCAFSYTRNFSQSDVNTIVGAFLANRDAADNTTPVWKRASSVFPVPESGPYKAILLERAANTWDTDVATHARFFWEKSGQMWTWEPVEQKPITVSLGQPVEMLLQMGCTLADLTRIPEADAQFLMGDSSRLYVLCKGAEGRTEMAGFPDNLLVTAENISKSWALARPGVDVQAVYVDAAREWRITNISSNTQAYRLAAIGAGQNTAVNPVRFGELVDGIDLFDDNPRTLVSVGGRFEKRRYIHPYLLGGI